MARCLPAVSIFHLIIITFFFFPSYTRAATSPSTSTPVPPLQWIQLSTSGTTLPGLKYPSIGYDATSGFLIIFGGESNGVPQQETYLYVIFNPLSSILFCMLINYRQSKRNISLMIKTQYFNLSNN